MILKRFILIILILSAGLSAGCAAPADADSDGRINIVCTIFPQYDWVRRIIGEENAALFELTLLIDGRADLHSYSPSVQDIAKIAASDIFIYTGGGSDGWAEAVLRQNAGIAAVNLMHILGGHEHDECEGEHGGDEHIWLSLKNAGIICGAIADILSEKDPDNAQIYKNNLEAYAAGLDALDAEYQDAAASAAPAALVFADRFPFSYMAADYGISCYAAFSGCSAETEASFATIISLADIIDKLGLSAVMVTESSDQSIARTLINNTEHKNQKILVLDSMQSVAPDDIKNGAAYLLIMQNNLKVLKEALK